tara:strand:- start:2486 stop:3100 length:615 start_codon:yes stop_codon:yes gene_type:complete
MMCDLCGEGTLEEKQGVNTVTYKNVSRELTNTYCECDTCGVEVTMPEQTRDNKRRMVAFKKEVDGLLTGTEVRELRERLGLKQAEAVKVFGGGAVAFSKYEKDDVTQSEAMDKLLRLAGDVPEAFARLCQNAQVNMDHTRATLHQDRWHQVYIMSYSQSDRPCEFTLNSRKLVLNLNTDPHEGLATNYVSKVPNQVVWSDCQGC